MTTRRLDGPVVHRPWTAAWFDGDATRSALFGDAPSIEAVAQVARRHDAQRPDASWRTALHGTRAANIADDALVVLAGQQPVVAGGAALVAHKAATAVAMARVLSGLWDRQVVPVFLMATQDHDTSEIDHVDVMPEHGTLRRLRCPVTPKHEMFHRCRWNDGVLRDILAAVAPNDELVTRINDGTTSTRFASHVAVMLDEAFGELGLVTLDAHDLEESGRDVLARALGDTQTHRDVLARGAESLHHAGLDAAFDPDDPRPLVLESRDEQRRRVEAGDVSIGARFAADPTAFSPHAALRPIVQAKSLPVVAQVCGPSEIVYLAQARALHELHDAVAPVLVPRMEASFVPDDSAFDEASRTLRGEGVPIVAEEQALIDAARAFTRSVAARDELLDARLRRWADSLQRSARRLAEAPSFRGKPADARTSWLRPRGRAQDAVLAWLPQLAAADHPAAWGAHIVSMARPFEAPVHILHSGPAR